VKGSCALPLVIVTVATMRVADGRDARGADPEISKTELKEEELASLLPWGLGTVIETFANTLDEIISETMDEWNLTPEKKASVGRAGRRCTPEADVGVVVVDDEPPVWNISWNDIFGEADAERACPSPSSPSPSPRSTLSSALARPATPPRHQTGDGDVAALQKELRRSKKQNEHLKKKISGLQEQLDRALPREAGDGGVTADEHVTLRMQIEHLLAQKCTLGYENDSLRRENQRLCELVDYFLGGAAGDCEEIDEEDQTSSSADSLIAW